MRIFWNIFLYNRRIGHNMRKSSFYACDSIWLIFSIFLRNYDTRIQGYQNATHARSCTTVVSVSAQIIAQMIQCITKILINLIEFNLTKDGHVWFSQVVWFCFRDILVYIIVSNLKYGMHRMDGWNGWLVGWLADSLGRFLYALYELKGTWLVAWKVSFDKFNKKPCCPINLFRCKIVYYQLSAFARRNT